MDSKFGVVDAIAQSEIIQNLSEKLRAYYIYPDIAEKTCIRLQKNLEEGDYSDITEGEFLAYTLITHMVKIVLSFYTIKYYRTK
jgi:hypothetical protein